MIKYKNSKLYPIYKTSKILLSEALKNLSIKKTLRSFARIAGYVKDYRSYKKLHKNNIHQLSLRYIYPCIWDRTETTPVDEVYFYQDSWAVGKIINCRPKKHVDVGSTVTSIGILSQVIPTTFVDIRTIKLKLPQLTFKEGTIVNLPFQDGSIESLSSICVIEHIGLGRYGDPLDPEGTERAASELSRVLAPGGNLYISVPVDNENRVYFNAHRSFTPQRVQELFPYLELIEEGYIHNGEIEDTYSSEMKNAVGLYHFRKNKSA